MPTISPGANSPFSLATALRIGLALRAAALGLSFTRFGPGPETWEYEVIARNLLDGGSLVFDLFGTAYRSNAVPVFPAFCAALHWLGGDGLGLYFGVQLLLAGAFIVLMHQLANILFGPRVAALVAFLAALEPGLIVYQSYKVDVALLASCLMLVSATALFSDARPARWALPFTAGALAGCAVLTRPDAVALLGIPILLAWARRMRWAATSLFLGAFIGGMTMAVAPWLQRNYALHARILMTTTEGQLLWAGNNPASTGTLWTVEGKPIYSTIPAALRKSLEGTGELAHSDAFRAEALLHINADPIASLRRWGRTMLYYWTFAPDYSNRHYYRHVPRIPFLAYRLLFPAIVLAALWGTVAAYQSGTREHLALWAVPVGLSFIHAVHYVEGRHRLLALPFLLILAARGFVKGRGPA